MFFSVIRIITTENLFFSDMPGGNSQKHSLENEANSCSSEFEAYIML
jgi:hypothetical protein